MWFWFRNPKIDQLIELAREQVKIQKEILSRLWSRFTVKVAQEKPMISTPGTQGNFNAVLNDNGSPIALPAGSSWTWSISDANAQVTAVPTDPTGATVVVSVPASDVSTSITVTATTTDPTGASVSGDIVVPITGGTGPQKFTVTVTQVS